MYAFMYGPSFSGIASYYVFSVLCEYIGRIDAPPDITESPRTSRSANEETAQRSETRRQTIQEEQVTETPPTINNSRFRSLADKLS